MTLIDRIDDKGNITEHIIDAGSDVTWCGLIIKQSQQPCGNKPCGRCARILRQRNGRP